MRRPLQRSLLALAFAGVVWATVVLWSYRTVPLQNVDDPRVDALIVLGVPTNEDGTISPEGRERTLEAVREFRAGRAKHMILSGGAAHNRFIEGAVMAGLAEREGVPAQDVIIEGQAQNTIQNIFYSRAIMAEHGWTSAEIVSSPSHLPRTALILEHYRGAEALRWRTNAARWPVEYSLFKIAGIYFYEATGTTKLRWFGFRPTRFMPSDR